MDATIDELPIDAPGYVPWWEEKVMLFNVMAARLSDSTRHAGHADILRETIDGSVGVNPESASSLGDTDRTARRAEIERVALLHAHSRY